MKKFLIAIIILIGSFSLVGLIEKLNQTVAYDNLFYIQEIDTYIDVLKDADSSFVYLYFQRGEEPRMDSCKDVVRIPEKRMALMLLSSIRSHTRFLLMEPIMESR